jgi:hypothetical protein
LALAVSVGLAVYAGIGIARAGHVGAQEALLCTVALLGAARAVWLLYKGTGGLRSASVALGILSLIALFAVLSILLGMRTNSSVPAGLGEAVAVVLVALGVGQMQLTLRIKQSELEVRAKLLEIEYSLAMLAERLGGDSAGPMVNESAEHSATS